MNRAGRGAYPATLTGQGEGVHIARPDVNLDTHITDVAKAERATAVLRVFTSL